MSMATALGYVYTVSRIDLKKCYIGQSIRTRRPRRHLKPGRYVYDELCADGGTPHIERLDESIPQGDMLDEAERDWMRAFAEEGWTVINRCGPDDVLNCKSDAAALGGRFGGRTRAKQILKRQAEEPAWWSAIASKGAQALQAMIAADPEVARKVAEGRALGNARSIEARRMKLENDPEYRNIFVESGRRRGKLYGANGGRAVARIQRQCEECGLGPTTPGGLGFHQSRTGHRGIIELGTLDKEV